MGGPPPCQSLTVHSSESNLALPDVQPRRSTLTASHDNAQYHHRCLCEELDPWPRRCLCSCQDRLRSPGTGGSASRSRTPPRPPVPAPRPPAPVPRPPAFPLTPRSRLRSSRSQASRSRGGPGPPLPPLPRGGGQASALRHRLLLVFRRRG